MAYEVLARKHRSRTFDEIVGQSAIATTLKNAVESGRIHHGYLFTGTRGVGKTSMARILAKSLNCFSSDVPTVNPCCECESCVRIADGSDLDVVEIDAASHTGVDNIRELRSNAAYKPARSRYKVYIIDEVHMLSSGAFNALLKTLEEPPDHVKFVLATTESHKVPATIKSRCQRFDFRSISSADIAEQIEKLLASEGVTADEMVIRRVSRLANGSMRDALSLLDQLLAYGAANLTAELIEDLLPTAYDDVLRDLFERVASDDAAGALMCVEKSLSAGATAERLCDSIIEYLRSLMLLAVCGTKTELLDLSEASRSQLAEEARRFDAATYVYMIGLMEEVRRQVKSSSAPRPLLDAAIVRLALSSSFSNISELVRRLEGMSAAEPSALPATPDTAKKKRAIPQGLT
jgi:DNA polymerase-3 subunit gamma/tau